MPKFSKGDNVKIVCHPTKPEYCGLEGKIADVRESLGQNTRGIGSSDELPDVGKQWKYDVQIQSHAPGSIVYDLIEEWLELVD